MPTLIAILIAVLAFFWWARRLAAPGTTPARSRKSCDWQRVDPEETRALKEYRCAACNEVAYGRGENLPAPRSCRAG